MALLTWDETGTRTYETGVDHGVLYMPNASGVYNDGVAWNGLVSVSESPSGAESNAQYADNIKYLNLLSAEDFAATIEAFTYPDEFAAYDGLGSPDGGGMVFGQQSRGTFGLSYRTIKGNDVSGDSYGYKLHLVYGCQASPSEKAYASVNDSPEAITFSWEISTTAVPLGGTIPGVDKPTALVVIDSTKVSAANLATLEGVLYGASGDPLLPAPYDVYQYLSAGATEITAFTGVPSITGQDLTITFQTGGGEVDWFVEGELVTNNDGTPLSANVTIPMEEVTNQFGTNYSGQDVLVTASPGTNTTFAQGLDTVFSISVP